MLQGAGRSCDLTPKASSIQTLSLRPHFVCGLRCPKRAEWSARSLGKEDRRQRYLVCQIYPTVQDASATAADRPLPGLSGKVKIIGKQVGLFPMTTP